MNKVRKKALVKKKVLVVEDNELNLKLFTDLLVSHGLEVFKVLDGKKAYKEILQTMPDLILMDIQLHGISGIEVIEKIKSDEEIKNIPIVAVTAFAMREDKEKILKAGCEAYIAKPISIDNFFETVDSFLFK